MLLPLTLSIPLLHAHKQIRRETLHVLERMPTLAQSHSDAANGLVAGLVGILSSDPHMSVIIATLYVIDSIRISSIHVVAHAFCVDGILGR